MPSMVDFSGIGKALEAKERELRGKERVTVAVGYTQQYALYVHENMNARHPVGQAKYLEQPARELASELGKMVAEGMAAGMTMEESLLVAGLRLQRESQQLVPVDTAALKNSAFTEVER